MGLAIRMAGTMPEHSQTPVTFSHEVIAKIYEMLATREEPPTCPRCETTLTVEQIGEGSFAGQFHVSCWPCHRTAFISIQPRGGSFNR